MSESLRDESAITPLAQEKTCATEGADPIASLEAAATKVRTSCGDGQMIWRSWGAGPTLLLLHGGHGSWMHWLRNISGLSGRYRLLVPDMPGYGDSDEAPEPANPERVATIVADGLDRLSADPVALVGFSFGGVIGGHVARLRPDLVQHLVLVGSGGMGLTRPPMLPLKNWRGMKQRAERDAAHAHNLSVLMIHDPERIDELAVRIQSENTIRARGISRAISMTTTLRDCLPHVRAQLAGIWGEQDATAVGYLGERRQLLKSIVSQAEFVVIPDAGHWVAYEKPGAFNDALIMTLSGRAT